MFQATAAGAETSVPAAGLADRDGSDPTETAPVRRSRTPGRRRLVPYLYLLPAVLFLVVWTYLPLAQTFELSFYDWNLIPTSPREPVGFDNYTEVLALPEMQQAVGNTVIYILAAMLFSIVLSLLIALLARRAKGRAKIAYEALIFVPYLVTPVATSAVWRWLFAEDSGLLSQGAQFAGLDIGNVFRDPDTALWAIVIVVGWQMLGFGVLVISAGIAGISPDYAQAASMDGAGSWRILRTITVPLLSPTIVFLGLMTVLLSAQWAYPAIDILTQGGPNGASNNIYHLLYQFGFQNFDAGLSAAAGVLFFLVFTVVAWAFTELSDRLSFYDN